MNRFGRRSALGCGDGGRLFGPFGTSRLVRSTVHALVVPACQGLAEVTETLARASSLVPCRVLVPPPPCLPAYLPAYLSTYPPTPPVLVLVPVPVPPSASSTTILNPSTSLLLLPCDPKNTFSSPLPIDPLTCRPTRPTPRRAGPVPWPERILTIHTQKGSTM